MTMNTEVENTFTVAVVAYFDICTIQQMPRGTEENTVRVVRTFECAERDWRSVAA
jgi:hypothetical protein